MAGIQALVNQSAGGSQGNPNYVYYQLAANDSCNSSDGDSAVSGCVFHNITKGDIDVNCGGTVNCFGATSSRFGGRGGRLDERCIVGFRGEFRPGLWKRWRLEFCLGKRLGECLQSGARVELDYDSLGAIAS